jgi:hypothetical protein
MTQVELNPVEIYMILRCLKQVRTVLDVRPPIRGLEFKEDELEVRSKEIQSIAYKLEKYLKDFEPYEL